MTLSSIVTLEIFSMTRDCSAGDRTVMKPYLREMPVLGSVMIVTLTGLNLHSLYTTFSMSSSFVFDARPPINTQQRPLLLLLSSLALFPCSRSLPCLLSLLWG